jgi:formylglycine-generating enzyme required for sulfatase activity
VSPPLDDLGARLQAALGAGYVVERSIGQGGFAAVYLVRDLTLKRPLAVKVLTPDLLLSGTALERFRREAETIAQLAHPHIVPIHFIGGANDVFYLAMAYVDGESLADRIGREGRIGVDETARILREVASALDFAHRRGVIHRDIKPHNVLLEQETGRALVTDFGIARTAEAASLTVSGMVIGTPAYMSPEQVTASPVDHRSDLYALGIVGYEMLTGRPPFGGDTPTETLMKRVAHPAEPVQRVRPDTPPALAEVVNRCLEQEPARRFATGGEIVRLLGGAPSISAGHSTAELVRGARRSHLALLPALAAVILLVTAAGYWLLRGRETREPPPAPSAPPVPEGMVVIPAGTYTVGRNDGRAWLRPAHQVALRAFALERTEVTVGAYRKFVAATGAQAPWSTPPDSLLPVSGVMWGEATAYCGWRYPGRGRLPREEEWEAAARGPGALRYPWGATWQAGAANTQSAGRDAPAAVGSYPRGNTSLGVSDLIGNVWEWTSSRMEAYPGGQAAPRSEGTYVIRGGGFNTLDALADATYRGWQPPTGASRADLSATGFRCVVPLP